MTRLSVNINKIATLRNARGGKIPDPLKVATDCEHYGADGITVHPRPDERHITRLDVEGLHKIVKTEFNIEGNPTQAFIELVLKFPPTQVTLVPDEPAQLTSDHGWDTRKNLSFLKRTIKIFQQSGIRTSIFLDPDPEMVPYAAETGTNRIELYTESYAKDFFIHPDKAIEKFIKTAEAALDAGLELNAGHDLNLDNLSFFCKHIPNLMEVSIGHSLIADALYYGLQNTIQMYKRAISLASDI